MKEVKRIQSRLRKKALIVLLPAIYFSAVGVRIIENIFTDDFSAELSPIGWIIAILFGGWKSCAWFLHSRKIGRDMQEKTILGLWVEHVTGGKELEQEALPFSEIVWSVRGYPSEWRLIEKF